jgi:hypothetical protein
MKEPTLTLFLKTPASLLNKEVQGHIFNSKVWTFGHMISAFGYISKKR